MIEFNLVRAFPMISAAGAWFGQILLVMFVMVWVRVPIHQSSGRRAINLYLRGTEVQCRGERRWLGRIDNRGDLLRRQFAL